MNLHGIEVTSVNHKVCRMLKLSFTAFVVFASFFASNVSAEEFPSRDISVVTHAGDGGGTDVTTRMMMLRAQREIGTKMQIVNVPGGGGAEALKHLSSAPSDGYTILTFTTGHAAAIAKGHSQLQVSDLRPIARATEDPQILMARCGDFYSGHDFLEAQKERSLVYGISHVANIDDVSVHRFTTVGELKPPQFKSFGGGSEVAKALVDGKLNAAVLNLAEAGSEIEAGEICPMIVLSNVRMRLLPNVVTAIELGVDVVSYTVRGFVVHKDVPEERAAFLEEKLLRGMRHGVYQDYLRYVGLESGSVANANIWRDQMKIMVEEMRNALAELGHIDASIKH